MTKEREEAIRMECEDLLDLLREAGDKLAKSKVVHLTAWCETDGCICGSDKINNGIDALLSRIEEATKPTNP